jgi:tRNA modification GTPase
MRAFLAGRLDLTQAEAVLGVIDARSNTELQVALKQLAGGLAGPLHALRDQLLDLLAHLEAGLDFVEEDIQFISADQLDRQLQTAADAIEKLVNQLGRRSESSAEPRVVVRGLPNVGKSSLFNALVGAERSIVSPAASTTRDYVAMRISVAGHSVLLIDTAGVEETSRESLGSAAQRMTDDQFESAALELFCVDSTRPLTDWERQQLRDKAGRSRIVVFTKCDQLRRMDWIGPAQITSSIDGTGLPQLRNAIAEHLDRTMNDESAVVGSTAVRCADALRQVREGLVRARSLVRDGGGEELVAAELRSALDHLGIVVGTVYTDDILDRIFSRFCIGK